MSRVADFNRNTNYYIVVARHRDGYDHYLCGHRGEPQALSCVFADARLFDNYKKARRAAETATVLKRLRRDYTDVAVVRVETKVQISYVSHVGWPEQASPAPAPTDTAEQFVAATSGILAKVMGFKPKIVFAPPEK